MDIDDTSGVNSVASSDDGEEPRYQGIHLPDRLEDSDSDHYRDDDIFPRLHPPVAGAAAIPHYGSLEWWSVVGRAERRGLRATEGIAAFEAACELRKHAAEAMTVGQLTDFIDRAVLADDPTLPSPLVTAAQELVAPMVFAPVPCVATRDQCRAINDQIVELVKALGRLVASHTASDYDDDGGGDDTPSVESHVEQALGIAAFIVGCEERASLDHYVRALNHYRPFVKASLEMLERVVLVVNRYTYWTFSPTKTAVRVRNRAMLAQRLGCMVSSGDLCRDAGPETSRTRRPYLVTQTDPARPLDLTLTFSDSDRVFPEESLRVCYAMAASLIVRNHVLCVRTYEKPRPAAAGARAPVREYMVPTVRVLGTTALKELYAYSLARLPSIDSLLATMKQLTGELGAAPPHTEQQQQQQQPPPLTPDFVGWWHDVVIPSELLFVYVAESQMLWTLVWLEPATLAFCAALKRVLRDRYRVAAARPGTWPVFCDRVLSWSVRTMTRYARGQLGGLEIATIASELTACRVEVAWHSVELNRIGAAPLTGIEWWRTRMSLRRPKFPTVIEMLGATVALFTPETRIPWPPPTPPRPVYESIDDHRVLRSSKRVRRTDRDTIDRALEPYDDHDDHDDSYPRPPPKQLAAPKRGQKPTVAVLGTWDGVPRLRDWYTLDSAPSGWR